MKRIEPATLAELAALTAAMPDRLQLAVLLGAWCSMRYGEIAELRRGDLDLAHGKVRIRRGVPWVDGHPIVGPPKTAAGVRYVSIPPHLIPIVEDHLPVTPGRAPTPSVPRRPGGQMWAPTQVLPECQRRSKTNPPLPGGSGTRGCQDSPGSDTEGSRRR